MDDSNINAIKFIHSVHEFVNEIKLLDQALANSKVKGRLFFRGQFDSDYQVSPSIFRNGWLSEESNMYSKLLLSSPSDFSGQATAYEKLTKMQHYGLPTRLLDVTSNPLVALYFACKRDPNIKDYRGIRRKIPENKYCQIEKMCPDIINDFMMEHHPYGEVFVVADEPLDPDDDRITVLSELAHLCKENNFTIKKFTMKLRPYLESDFDKGRLKQYLVEKPYRSVVSSMNNARIKAQSGAFILFGLIFDPNEDDLFSMKKTPFDIKNKCVANIREMRNEYLTGLKNKAISLGEEDLSEVEYIKHEVSILPDLDMYDKLEDNTASDQLYSYIIPPECKERILVELEQLGICHATLFPELEHQALYIKQNTPIISGAKIEDIDVIIRRIEQKNIEQEQKEKELFTAKNSFNKRVTNKNTVIEKSIHSLSLEKKTENDVVKALKLNKQLFSQTDWFNFPDKIASNKVLIKKILRSFGISKKEAEDVADLIVNKMLQVNCEKAGE